MVMVSTLMLSIMLSVMLNYACDAERSVSSSQLAFQDRSYFVVLVTRYRFRRKTLKVFSESRTCICSLLQE